MLALLWIASSSRPVQYWKWCVNRRVSFWAYRLFSLAQMHPAAPSVSKHAALPATCHCMFFPKRQRPTELRITALWWSSYRTGAAFSCECHA